MKRGGFFNFKAFAQIKRQLKEQGITRKNTVLLQVHRSIRSSLLACYLGLPSITYHETPMRFHAHWKVPRVAVFHEMTRIAMLLVPFNISRQKILKARPSLDPLPLDHSLPWSKWFEHDSDIEVIAIAPGSVWGTKRWPVDSFARLVQKLLANRSKSKIVLIGSPGEKDQASEIMNFNHSFKGRIVDLVGQTNLSDLRRIIPRAKLLVANDSSPIHFASAFSVATVAVFGATIPAMGFGPMAPYSQTLGVSLDCRPCSDHGPRECPLGHFKCMKTLSVDSVFQACNDILAATGTL
jgi:heptosyltransferase-2